jgi:alkanesulfonate monooxygenase SsuD/methylene tetrahydromethanopterin reductase-like flavin-dependent oxidoreductase (luciferase family)
VAGLAAAHPFRVNAPSSGLFARDAVDKRRETHNASCSVADSSSARADHGKKNPTVRDFINVSGRGTVKEHVMFCGNPGPVADQMEEWFTAPACDGFVLAATSMPGAYDDAVRLLVPELQRRGLFQKEYAGTTLRENLGLAIPRATDWHAARRKASARHL